MGIYIFGRSEVEITGTLPENVTRIAPTGRNSAVKIVVANNLQVPHTSCVNLVENGQELSKIKGGRSKFSVLRYLDRQIQKFLKIKK